MRDKLRVAGMIDSFYAGDDFRQLGVMEPDVLDQFGLCIRRSGNENRTRVCDRFGDGFEIVMVD